MAKITATLAVPAGAGSGAGSDTSQMGALRTITVEGAFEGTLNIETSLDNGTTWVTVATFTQPDEKDIEIAGNMMRVTRLGVVVSGTPTVDVGALDDGGEYGALNVPAGAGAGATLDVSAFGTFMCVAVTGTYTDSITIEGSQDGLDWAPIQGLGFTQPDKIKSVRISVRFVRVVRVGTVSGLPVATIGATNDPQTSASGGPPGNCLIYQPGGGGTGPAVFDTWAALMAALTTLRNNANGAGCYTIVVDDSVTTPAPVPAGAWDLSGVTLSGGLAGEPASGRVVLEIADGATIPGLLEIRDNLLVRSLGASPLVFVDGSMLRIASRSRLEAAAAAPFVDATGLAGGESAVIILQDDAILGDDGDVAVEIGATGSLIFEMLSGSQIFANAVASAVGSSVQFNFRDSASTVSNTQPGILGGVANADFVIERWNVVTAQAGAFGAVLGAVMQCDPSGGPVTVTLPDVSTINKDQSVIVHNSTDSVANAITIDPAGADTVNGAATLVLNTARASVLLVSDGGTNWIVASQSETEALSSQTLVFQPGGTGAGPVLFSDWTALMAQLNLLRSNANGTGLFTIKFDDSLVSPAVIPAGAHDMTGVTWTADFEGGAGAAPSRVAVQVAVGATLPGLNVVGGNLSVTAAAGGAARRPLTDNETFVIRDSALVTGAGAVPFFSVPAAELATIKMEDDATLGQSLTLGVTLDVGGTLELRLSSRSLVQAQAITAPAGSTVNVFYDGSATLVETQTNVNAGATVAVVTRSIPGWQQTAVQVGVFGAAVGQLVRCDPTGGAFAVNLPAISRFNVGKTIVVKNVSASVNAITITPAGADTIDGAATRDITTARESVTVHSDGVSDWIVI